MIRSAQQLLALAAIPAICLSVTASAQEREIWACQQVEGAGLFWENGNWQVSGLNPQPLLLTIDGANGKWKQGDAERQGPCTTPIYSTLISCVDSTMGTSHVVLNRDAGIAAHSNVYGAVMPPRDGYRDSPSVGSYNCTKF
jgi:hypothetical protein